MKNNILNLLIIGLSFCLALFSCKKESSNLGIDGVSNKIDGIKVDTFSIITYTKPFDSTKTSGLSKYNLGAIYTKELGKSKSSCYFSLTPKSDGVSFPQSATLDSIYLEVNFHKKYGKAVDQNFTLYKINEIISSAKTYYSNNSLTLGSKVNSFSFKSDTVGTFKIKLDNTLGNEILASSVDVFENKANFQSLLNGLALVPDDISNVDEGTFYGFSSANLSIKLAFKTTENSQIVSKTKSFVIESSNDIFANFTKDFTSGDVQAGLQDSTLGQNLVFAQGLSGTEAYIEFPHLREWFNTNNKVLTQAQLILPYSAPNNANYDKLDTLYITRNVNNLDSTISSSQGSSDFLGIYNSTDKNFTFNLTYDLNHNFLKSNQKYFYKVNIWGFGINPNQVILSGPKANVGEKAKLIIYYSNL